MNRGVGPHAVHLQRFSKAIFTGHRGTIVRRHPLSFRRWNNAANRVCDCVI